MHGCMSVSAVYLTSDRQRVTKLGFSRAEFSKNFRDRSGFHTA